MDYIVFDLEWNQCPDGKKFENARLPFEIIEIGAVKLNRDFEMTDRFQTFIRPQVYRWIQEHIHEVIHVDYEDLADGLPFPEAAGRFLDWCGTNFCFMTWGDQDVMELQRNMKFYGLLERLPGPVPYYNVQRLFAKRFEKSMEQRALEYAAARLEIPQEMEFHRALGDAYYTACVAQRVREEVIPSNSSLDVYQNPKSRSEEIHISGPGFDEFVSREFSIRERVMKDREILSVCCPICHNPAKRKIRWFSNNSRVFYSLFECREHGDIAGQIRIRRTDEDAYFALKKIRCTDKEGAEGIRRKREGASHKRDENPGNPPGDATTVYAISLSSKKPR